MLKMNAKDGKNMKLRLIIVAYILVLSLGSASQVARVKGDAPIQVIVSPQLGKVDVGDKITLTVNVTNVPNLMLWQFVLKYNATVADVSEHFNNQTNTFEKEIWIPDSNVFSGRTIVPGPPTTDNDTRDSFQYFVYGVSLLSLEHVQVTNGILFQMNLTARSTGSTALAIVTKDSPVHFSSVDWDILYTFLEDSNFEMYTFETKSGSLLVGESSLPPVAKFSVVSPIVDNNTNLVLYGHQPPNNLAFAQSFKNMVTGFNASASFDADGKITKYVWYFGDHTPQVETTDPYTTHVFNQTGPYTVQFYVVDNATKPLSSETVTQLIVVGLVLDYFSWAPLIYFVLAVVVASVGVYVFLQSRRYVRERRLLKARMTQQKR